MNKKYIDSNKEIFDSVNGEYAMYLRKSRADFEAEERGEGETLARHEKILIDIAKSMQIKIGKTYKEIVSGESIENRPIMQEMLEDVKHGMWKGILVVEVERLARGNTKDQGIVSEAFKFFNTKIITPIKIYDPNNEFDEEYFEFGLFMSRREYKVINRRLQNGRISSVKEGKYVGSIPPFGYDRMKISKEKGYTLIPNDEAKIVNIIYEMYAYNDISINEMTKRINIMNFKPRKSEKWTASALKDILRNPVYIGKIKWNSRKVVKLYKNEKIIKTRPRNKNFILVDGIHNPIIDEKTWKLVQEKLNVHVPPVKHNNKVQNPLLGIVYCAKCGKSMQRKPNKLNDILICPNINCNNISSKLYIIENKIIKVLNNYLERYQINFEDYLKDIDNHNKESSGKLIKDFEKELKIQNKKFCNIYDLFEEGTYDKETFKRRCSAISNRIEVLKKRIEQQNKEEVKVNKETSIYKIKNIIDIYKELETAEEKNLLLKTLLERVNYKKNIKTIKRYSDQTDFELDIFPKIYK